MALVRTTNSSAILAGDTKIIVASATGFANGYTIRVNGECMKVSQEYVSGTTIPVLRGRLGTAVVAHPVTSGIICGIASDWGAQSMQTVTEFPIAGRARNISSYSASGAISLSKPGADEMAILNSTSTLTMTLAVPSKDLDGTFLWLVANGNAAHTVTLATALGGGTGTTLTFNASGLASVQLLAMNSLWVLCGYVGGTLTNSIITAT